MIKFHNDTVQDMICVFYSWMISMLYQSKYISAMKHEHIANYVIAIDLDVISTHLVEMK